MVYRHHKWLVYGLVFCLLIGVSVSASDGQELLSQMERFSQEMYTSSQSAGFGGANSDAAIEGISKEIASFEGIQRTLSRIQTPREADEAITALRQFGYRMTTSAEKKALNQTSAALENRLKFLAVSDGSDFIPMVDKLERLRIEVDRKPVASHGSVVRNHEVLASRSPGRRGARSDEMLGFSVKNGKTHFSVYAPAATKVNVIIFERSADKTGESFPMKKGPDGIWRRSVDGELYGKFYGYSASGPTTDGYRFNPNIILSDPYALANVGHDGKSVIVRTDYNWTINNFRTPAAEDLIIYEMHVKDTTEHKSSGVTGAKRGKYLGLLEGRGTDKVMGHLVDLGINAVELLPIHEFDQNFAGHPNHWGYMTSHFFAPHSAYASGRYGQAVKEFKQVVEGFHREGIAVILDVVYNHTAEGDHRGGTLNFRGLDNPGYYRMMDDKFHYWNGSGCGNEFRSESPMARKLILDSLKYWVREYRIDGFRIDLGALIDKETMDAIINELPQNVVLFAEPWAADWGRSLWGKSDFRNTRLAKWNDDFRENIRAFVRGQGNRNNVMTVLAGTCFWWAAKPTESLNYVEAHDGYTVNDLFDGNQAMARLAATALLTAQGIPMIHQGQEFNRSKQGNNNSYDQDNEINWIDWGVKETNIELYRYYRGLIHLRRKYENFRHATPLNSQMIEWIKPPNQKAVGYHLKGETDFVVLLNGDHGEWVTFNLPGDRDWIVVSNGTEINDESGLGTARGNYRVPPVTGVILKNR